MGIAANGAEGELRKAMARAVAQKDNVFEGGLINAIEQITGKQPLATSARREGPTADLSQTVLEGSLHP
jgi:hypothetical protein